MRHFFEAVRDIGLILAGVLAWVVMVSGVRDGEEIFWMRTMGLYALGMLLVSPVVANPTTTIGELFSGVFKVIGVILYVAAKFFAILWILGIAMILGVHGITDPYAPAAILWLPVYLGIPAWIALATSENFA